MSRPKSSLPLALVARQSKERSPVVRNRSQRNLSVNLDATPNFAPDKDDVSSIQDEDVSKFDHAVNVFEKPQ